MSVPGRQTELPETLLQHRCHAGSARESHGGAQHLPAMPPTGSRFANRFQRAYCAQSSRNCTHVPAAGGTFASSTGRTSSPLAPDSNSNSSSTRAPEIFSNRADRASAPRIPIAASAPGTVSPRPPPCDPTTSQPAACRATTGAARRSLRGDRSARPLPAPPRAPTPSTPRSVHPASDPCPPPPTGNCTSAPPPPSARRGETRTDTADTRAVWPVPRTSHGCGTIPARPGIRTRRPDVAPNRYTARPTSRRFSRSVARRGRRPSVSTPDFRSAPVPRR